MTKLSDKAIIAMVKEYEGFGQVYSGKEWAEMLDMDLEQFAYYTNEKGLTVKDLYAIKGITYREPKRGRRMAETRKRIEYILLRSGYLPDSLDLTAVNGQPAHRIFVDNELIGRYFYKDDRLVLNNGEGYYLGALEGCEVLLVHGRDGWDWHPEAKQAGFKARLM